jgi:hypothetical protein
VASRQPGCVYGPERVNLSGANLTPANLSGADQNGAACFDNLEQPQMQRSLAVADQPSVPLEMAAA